MFLALEIVSMSMAETVVYVLNLTRGLRIEKSLAVLS